MDKDRLKYLLLRRRQCVSEEDCWISDYCCDSKGYPQIRYQSKLYYVHRMAAFIWLGYDWNPERCVCHTCDNPKCFNPDHLFIGTLKENTRDMLLKKRHVHGENVITSKLSEKEVTEIKNSYKSQPEIAAKYGITQQQVSKIRLGLRWRHLN